MSVQRSIVVLTLVSLIIPFFAFFNRNAAERRANPPRTLQLYTVARGDVLVTINAIGQVEAEESSNLSVAVSGRIEEIMVQPGDYVLAGDVLLRQETDLEQIEYQNALLALEAAELEMEDLLNQPSEEDIRKAEAEIQRAFGAFSEVNEGPSQDALTAAQLAYQQAVEAYDGANRARRVAGGLTADAIALLDAQIGEASFNLELARLRLEDLQRIDQEDLNAAGARITLAQRRLEQVLAGPAPEEFDRATVAIQRAQTNLEQAQEALDQRVLTAPFDGVITEVNFEEGERITPGEEVMLLTDTDPLHVEVEVDEVDIRFVREGLPASIDVDALPDTLFDATIEEISLIGEDDEGIISYNVDLTLDQGDERIRPGMTAEASVVVDSVEDVLVVPNFYLTIDRLTGDATAQLLLDDGAVEVVAVELGLQGLDSSEIVSGLEEGDVVTADVNQGRQSFFN